MSSNNPKVSVVIPAYNREETIDQAIESVFHQTYNNMEVIVVDDGSTDSTVEVVKEYSDPKLSIVEHNENRGGSAARNTGVKEATGKYISFLDSDDRWKPIKTQLQVKLLESRDSSWIASYCNVEHISGNIVSEIIKNSSRYAKKEEGGRELVPNVLSLEFDLGGASTLMAKSSVVNSMGGFDSRFERHQDFEFLIRLLKQGQVAHAPYPLVLKQSTGYPAIEKVENAKYELFNKFEEDVRAAESDNIPIRKHHKFDLARCHMAVGDWQTSLKLLIDSKPYGTGVLGFTKATIDRLL
jgi:glycosyltransferase involved in cell wall biosynthesis